MKHFIKAFGNLKKNRALFERLEQQWERLNKRMDRLRGVIADGDRVAFIHQGHAIGGSEPSRHSSIGRLVGLEGPQSERSASIYTNANNSRRFGLALDFSASDGHLSTEDFCGAGYRTRAEAKRLALRWIVDGTKPTPAERRYR